MGRVKYVVLCCVFLLLSCVDSSDVSDKRNTSSDSATIAPSVFTEVSVDDIQAAINSGSTYRTIEAISAVNGMRYRGSVIPFIIDLWELKRAQYPDLNWNLVAEDVVRLNIANVLAQASRYGVRGIDIEPLRRFALRSLSGKDPDAIVAAIGVLRIIDNPEDVPKIVEIALKQEKSTFRLSVLALTAMCSPDATDAVDRLYNTVESEEMKKIIDENRKEMSEFKARTGWCELQ